MPGNIIVVNDWAKFYVGDSKMSDLMAYLEDKGFGENKVAKKLIKDRKEELRQENP